MVSLLSLSISLDIVNALICLVYIVVEAFLANHDLFATTILGISIVSAVVGCLKFSLIIGVMTLVKGAALIVILVDNPLSAHSPVLVKCLITLFLGQLILYSFGLTVVHLVKLVMRPNLIAEVNVSLDDCTQENCTGCNLHLLNEDDAGFVHVQSAVDHNGQDIMITTEHVDGVKVVSSYLLDELNVLSG